MKVAINLPTLAHSRIQFSVTGTHQPPTGSPRRHPQIINTIHAASTTKPASVGGMDGRERHRGFPKKLTPVPQQRYSPASRIISHLQTACTAASRGRGLISRSLSAFDRALHVSKRFGAARKSADATSPAGMACSSPSGPTAPARPPRSRRFALAWCGRLRARCASAARSARAGAKIRASVGVPARERRAHRSAVGRSRYHAHSPPGRPRGRRGSTAPPGAFGLYRIGGGASSPPGQGMRQKLAIARDAPSALPLLRLRVSPGLDPALGRAAQDHEARAGTRSRVPSRLMISPRQRP
jgi:hypothetical protein